MQFRTQRGNLLTLCERKTRFILTAPLKTKTAAETGQVIARVMGSLPQEARKTTAVIPPRKNRKVQYDYDKTIYRQCTIIKTGNPHPFKGSVSD